MKIIRLDAETRLIIVLVFIIFVTACGMMGRKDPTTFEAEELLKQIAKDTADPKGLVLNEEVIVEGGVTKADSTQITFGTEDGEIRCLRQSGGSGFPDEAQIAMLIEGTGEYQSGVSKRIPVAIAKGILKGVTRAPSPGNLITLAQCKILSAGK